MQLPTHIAANKAKNKEENRLRTLLADKAKWQNKLKEIERAFREEGENEDAWPGHEGSVSSQLEQERLMAIAHLSEIEKAIKNLSGV